MGVDTVKVKALIGGRIARQQVREIDMGRATRSGGSVALAPSVATELQARHAAGQSDAVVASWLNSAGAIWKRPSDPDSYGTAGMWSAARVADWLDGE